MSGTAWTDPPITSHSMSKRIADQPISTLHIRNMVCDRCRTAVDRLLDDLGVAHGKVHLGEVELENELDPRQRAVLAERLEQLGFGLVDDKRVRIIERVKQLVIELVRGNAMETSRKEKLSAYLAREAGMDYSGLSKLFSSVEGLTVERYYNLQRIERAKELLVYDELSVGQIADQLGYSSVHHLSNQFNQYVGHSPSHFKKIGAERRRSLDRVHQA